MSSRKGLVHTYCSFVSYIGNQFKGSQRQLPRRNLEKLDNSSSKWTVQQALDDSLFHIVPSSLYTAGRKIILVDDLLNENSNEHLDNQIDNQIDVK